METENLNYVGLDIGREMIDAAWYENNRLHRLKVTNNRKGFSQLTEHCGMEVHYVMESTGPYSMGLALHLHQQSIRVSVVNALVIKRFIQMHLEKNKSDEKDAEWVCRFAINQHPELWQAPQTHIVEARQMQSTIRQLIKQRTASINALKSLECMPIVSKEAKRCYEKQNRSLDKEINRLEDKIQELLMEHEGGKMKALQSIPSIGKRASATMIIATDGFRKVDNYRQLSSWAGLSPKEHSSGTSIWGKVRISRMGGTELRTLLFMCSMNAIKNNRACRELYTRLKAKGKNGKVALCAVSNKLIKQCVAIAQSEKPYNETYQAIRC